MEEDYILLLSISVSKFSHTKGIKMPAGSERQGDRLNAYKNKGKDSEVGTDKLLTFAIYVLSRIFYLRLEIAYR